MMQANVRAISLFGDYVLLPREELAAAMAALQNEDPATHLMLSSMLAADAQDVALEGPPLELFQRVSEQEKATAELRVGTRIGPWRIERVVGVGGMGAVYEAWRDDGHYQQRAALKCISDPLKSPQLVEAFVNERNTLAKLDHASIAPLLDGGMDEQGLPWFAMRFVEGNPVDQWCDARHMGVRQRMVLLAEVCDAVAYAHQRLVLHQDIKPSNVLVTEQGKVQLVDFGLSTALSSTERQLPRIALSYGYTAPEALQGLPPSTALDVYSLGMLMHQLLCGINANQKMAPAGTMQEMSPADPMSVLAKGASNDFAKLRGLPNAEALSGELAGDLDAIAAHCVQADPSMRYASVAELRDDLNRWLERRPVHSRNGGNAYKAGLFLRRHALAASLTGLVAVTAVAGLGISYWQTRRAADEAQSFVALAQVFEDTLGTATLSGLGDDTFSSSGLLSKTEAQVRQLAATQPKVMARGMLMLARSYAVIGDYPHAQALVQEAARLQADDALAVEVLTTQASLMNIAGQPAQALQTGQSALATLGQQTDNTHLRLQILTEIAQAHWDLAQHESAQATLHQALQLSASLRAQDPAPYIELLSMRGLWNLRMQHFKKADADLQQAIALASPRHPLLAGQAERTLARSLIYEERFKESLLTAQAQLQRTRTALGETHPQTGVAWQVLANSLFYSGDQKAAREALEKARAIIVATYCEDHPEYAEILRTLGFLLRFEGGNYEEMLATTRQSEAILRRAYLPEHDRVLRIQAQLGNQLGYPPDFMPVEQRRQLKEEAIPLLQSVIATTERKGLPAPLGARIFLARSLADRNRAGDLEQARQLLSENEAHLSRILPPTYSGRHSNDTMLAFVLYKMHEDTQADSLLREVISSAGPLLPSPSARLQLHTAFMLRAAIASRAGDRKAAFAMLSEAHRLVSEVYPEEHRLVRKSAVALDTLEKTRSYKY